jgi:signal transduction histidine kinase
MHTLVNEILTIYRIATREIELNIGPTNMQDLTDECVISFSQALAQRKIGLTFNKHDFPTVMQVDGDLVKLVFNNLIGNAIKYTPDGGSVTIQADNDGNILRVKVSDTGIGISKEEHQRIFERFYSTSNTELHSTSKTAFQGGGLGLGLSITKGIIDAHEGKIWVESAGKDEQKLPGSTFVLELPMRKTYQQVTPKAGEPN